MKVVADAGNGTASMPVVEQSEMLSTTDAALYLGDFKPATLEQWRWHNRGPQFVKLGRCVRYRKSDLNTYIDERIQGTSEMLAR
jgi:predicted DNA-binding transcriptional regulator AlpA